MPCQSITQSFLNVQHSSRILFATDDFFKSKFNCSEHSECQTTVYIRFIFQSLYDTVSHREKMWVLLTSIHRQINWFSTFERKKKVKSRSKCDYIYISSIHST